MVQLFFDGGGFMWPILGIFIIGLVFVIERLMHLIKGMGLNETYAHELADTIKNNNLNDAISDCQSKKGPVANLCLSALERADRGPEESQAALENVGSIEMASLEKNMTWISLCIATAPMLGFLGTIAGMIVAFGQIAAADNISPSIVAEGIGQALNTTAFGLVVAVILQFGQNIVMFIIDNMVVTIQKSTTLVLQSIAKKQK